MTWIDSYFQSRSDLRLSLYEYIKHCLFDPQWGYYRGQQCIGESGDFITAPEISPFFGETVALWLLQQNICDSKAWCLVECGGGRGVLMVDILRVMHHLKPKSLPHSVYFVECNPILMDAQRTRLMEAFPHIRCEWVESLAHVRTEDPVVVIGNEFLDVFPVRGFHVDDQLRLCEYHVVLDDDLLKLESHVVEEGDMPSIGVHEKNAGAVYEWAPDRQIFARELSHVMSHPASMGLFFDYGYDNQILTNLTVQALYQHRKVGIFDYPGVSDITAQVDFAAFCRDLSHMQLSAHLQTQQEFLLQNGAELLMQRAVLRNPQQEKAIREGFQRITYEMGQHFFSCVVKRKAYDGVVNF